MAEEDKTKQQESVAGGRSSAGSSSADSSPGGERRAALRGGGAVSDGSVERNPLPMRRASTLPDVSRYENGSGETTKDDDGAVPASASTASASDTSATRAARNDAASDNTAPDMRTPSDTTSPDTAAPDTTALSIRPPAEDVDRRAAERDEAVAAKPALPRVLQVLVAVFFPVMLLAAAIRTVTTPLFLWAEYNRPGFPADSYGFSTEDRITFASYTVDYILNWAPPRYLGGLVNADGEQLFLDSEVGHMLDVKMVLAISFAVAAVLAVFSIIACIYLARRYPGGVRRALFSGAVATLVLVAALTVAAALAWETFFSQVHAVFFADGTWTFRLDDTLIRLFPAQFWSDSAITVAALVLIVSVFTLVFTWPTKARREKSRAALEDRRVSYAD
ncbi:TIGR01906 family membrane protein [Arthrobacter sp. H5]|uniref:TIGR01906 family membrane protein n=1 Tax=Arthrobacter sp. H5 TaxID=1267973 RepID=UPI0004884EAD|nr:TIGR01906 family membrane protein [Arthrobacter sp. H5]